jgi:hypothetical protein
VGVTYWLRQGSICPTFLLEKIEIYLSKESSERKILKYNIGSQNISHLSTPPPPGI